MLLKFKNILETNLSSIKVKQLINQENCISSPVKALQAIPQAKAAKIINLSIAKNKIQLNTTTKLYRTSV